MNIRYIAAAVIVVATYGSADGAFAQPSPGITPASEPRPRAEQNTRLIIDCHDQRPPSTHAVAEFTGSHSIMLIRAERTHFIRVARRDCVRGADAIAFVRDGNETRSSLASVRP